MRETLIRCLTLFAESVLSMSEQVTYEQELLRSGKIIRTNVGVSMMPLLRQNKDVMIIERPSGRLKKYDVPLYKRGDQYVLHRIIKVYEDSYDIIGDNCVNIERGIKDEQIIGVLTGVIRDGKTISTNDFGYKLYYHLWCDLLYLRIAILKLLFFARRVARGLKRRFFGQSK